MILVDTGPIVALVNPRDQHHRWARETIGGLTESLTTCEAVLSEAFFLVSKEPNGLRRLISVLQSGAIQSHFSAQANLEEIAALLLNYQSLPMSFADACLVRMAEVNNQAIVITVDAHFHIYRKNGSEIIPLLHPLK